MATISRDVLVNYINDLLKVELFKDYCPNGLQIEGQDTISKVIAGVTVTQELIDAAIDLKADTLLVHHGLFWKGDDFPLVGMKHKRCKALFNANINLLAYHLPLDAHPSLGNNAQLGNILGISTKKFFDLGGQPGLGAIMTLKSPISGEDFKHTILQNLNRAPIYVSGSKAPIKTVAWCTGGADCYIKDAFEQGADTYITGEASMQAVDFAKEMGMHFFAAGHHATERYGVKALGEHLAQKFKITVDFLDLDNPI